MKNTNKSPTTPKKAILSTDIDTGTFASQLSQENLTLFAGADKTNWHKKIVQEFSIDTDTLTALATNMRNVYEGYSQLHHLKKGALLPAHTLLFLEKIDNHALLIGLITDNVMVLNNLIKNTGYSRDDIMEIQILAALFGSKEILEYLKTEHKMTVNDEVLNMALLSGKFTNSELAALGGDLKPTYNSIRYAIKSGDINVFHYVVDQHHLKPGAEHLTTAAAINNVDMFDAITALGVQPSGNFIYKFATTANNQEIITRLENQYGYADKNSTPRAHS